MTGFIGHVRFQCEGCARLTSLFTEESVMMVSDTERFENKGNLTFVQDLVECGQRCNKYDGGHFIKGCEKTHVRFGRGGTCSPSSK